MFNFDISETTKAQNQPAFRFNPAAVGNKGNPQMRCLHLNVYPAILSYELLSNKIKELIEWLN